MYRFVVLVFCLFLITSCIAIAQDVPRAEVFGGYQYFHANSGLNTPGIDSFNLNGWNAAVNGYFNNYFGVTADFAGAYGTPSILGIGLKTRLHTFLFGPTVRFHNASRFTPFGHALFGGGHISGEVSGLGSSSETDFAWAAGGGLDANLNNRFAVRVGQFDFLQTRVGGTNQNNFRYSGGVVIRF